MNAIFIVALLIASSFAQSLTSLVPLPSGLSNQNGNTYLRSSTMSNVFGVPCTLTDTCQPATGTLASYIETRTIAPLGRVTGLSPALDRLDRAMTAVRLNNITLYNSITSEGMLCCRSVRGSPDRPSSHAFGAAIDFRINGQLDPRSDGQTQLGLLMLYPYMSAQGFFWGAGYSAAVEDAMHFEISNEVMSGWIAAELFKKPAPATSTLCSNMAWPAYRDNGPMLSVPGVVALQLLLNIWGNALDVTGVFDSNTGSAVSTFNVFRSLGSSSTPSASTWNALWPTTTIVSTGVNNTGLRAAAVVALLNGNYARSLALSDASTMFTAEVETAVRAVQAEQRILVTGAVDQPTFKALLIRCYGSRFGFAADGSELTAEADGTRMYSVSVIVIVLSALIALF